MSAAASLTDAFAEIESLFEAAHPGLNVVLNLAASSTLRNQILEGAPADVFAPADTPNMDRLIEAGEVAGTPKVFARNSLQIAVPVGNPAGIDGLDAFARDDLLIGLCAETAPCGNLARTVLARAGISPSVDTAEPNVRALLTKVETQELDAAITYATDVVSASGSVDGVDIPEDVNVAVEYPIAVLGGAPNPVAAAAFVAFVLSEPAQAVLRDHGFTSP